MIYVAIIKGVRLPCTLFKMVWYLLFSYKLSEANHIRDVIIEPRLYIVGYIF